MGSLLITILSNGISDFIIQTNDIAQGRKSEDLKERKKSNKKHFVQTFLTMLILLIPLFIDKNNIIYSSINLLIYVFIISIIHILIDVSKCKLEIHNSLRNRKMKSILFLLDQMFHIITIIAIHNIFAKTIKYNFLLYNLLPKLDRKIYYYILIIIIVLLYVVRGGVFFVNIIMEEIIPKYISQGSDSTKDETNNIYNSVSAYIGMLERFITVMFSINNQYSALALLITAKSIARGEEIKKDPNFGADFLVGTFLSIGLGIIGGEVIKFIAKYVLYIAN